MEAGGWAGHPRLVVVRCFFFKGEKEVIVGGIGGCVCGLVLSVFLFCKAFCEVICGEVSDVKTLNGSVGV